MPLPLRSVPRVDAVKASSGMRACSDSTADRVRSRSMPKSWGFGRARAGISQSTGSDMVWPLGSPATDAPIRRRSPTLASRAGYRTDRRSEAKDLAEAFHAEHEAGPTALGDQRPPV